MIGSLRGMVIERGLDGEALVECGGVGYRVVVAPRTLSALAVDQPVFLHIHHHIREDAQTLYGFLGRDERVGFEALLGAHGVGPALAMAILSVHTPAALRHAVAAGDLDALCLVPGVGKKTATRLLIELKNRLDVDELDIATVPGVLGTGASVTADVREALTGLGYSAEEIRDVLRDAVLNPDAAVMLRDALKALGARRA